MSLDTLSIWPCLGINFIIFWVFPKKSWILVRPCGALYEWRWRLGLFFLLLSSDACLSAVISRQPNALGSWKLVHTFLMTFCITIFFRILNFLFFWFFWPFLIFRIPNLSFEPIKFFGRHISATYCPRVMKFYSHLPSGILHNYFTTHSRCLGTVGFTLRLYRESIMSPNLLTINK